MVITFLTKYNKIIFLTENMGTTNALLSKNKYEKTLPVYDKILRKK